MKQGITERSAVQQYPIGMRLTLDERVFRYARASDNTYGHPATTATQLRRGYGVYSGILGVPTENSVAAANAAIGAARVSYTTIGAFAANRFQGGYMVFDTGAGYGHAYRIKAHPASSGAGVTVVFILGERLAHAVTAGDGIVLFESPYLDVRSGRQEAIEGVAGAINAGYGAYIGVPLVDALAGEFLWVQVKGPAFIVSAAGTDGATVVQRLMMWNVDGSVTPLATSIGAVQSHQIAGYLLPVTQTALTPPAVGAASPSALDYIYLTGND